MKKALMIFALFTILISFSGCSKEVESIAITEESVELTVGETYDLSFKITPEGAACEKISWFSSYEKVATVEDGKITALSAGSTKIKAITDNGSESNIIFIHVSNPPSDTAYDKLNQNEKIAYAYLTHNDILYKYFKEPSSVTVRDIQEFKLTDKEGKETLDGSSIYVTLAAENGFGGNTIDSYVFGPSSTIMSLEEYIRLWQDRDIDFVPLKVDLTRLNRALKEYFEEKGW